MGLERTSTLLFPVYLARFGSSVFRRCNFMHDKAKNLKEIQLLPPQLHRPVPRTA